MLSNEKILKELIEINNEIKDINNLIDKKTIEIYNQKEEFEKKIEKYKICMELIILEYHKTCKEMFMN
jgi:hypothetical protein